MSAAMADDCTFEHEAFFYDSDAQFVGGLTSYLLEGLRLREAVIVVVPAAKAALLRTALGPDAEEVSFIDAEEWYRHPARTIARYDAVLRDLAGRRARVVGEVQFGATSGEWADWTRYEAALNRALARHDARVVCPYDLRMLPATVVADARRTHPSILGEHGPALSSDYVVPELLVSAMRIGVERVQPDAPELDLLVRTGDLREARRAFTTFAGEHLDSPRVAELSVAVNEILTNALVHGGGSAHLRGWSTQRGTITCQIDDDGPGSADPLLGFVPPPQEAVGGRGMWLARQLFDQAEFVAHDGGFRVSLVASAGR